LPKPRIGGLLISCLLLLGASPSPAEVFSVDAVKAAFLYRFASYVEWPGDSGAGPLVIAVAGSEQVASQLEVLLPRLSEHGRPAQIRRVSRVSDLEGVHILYVGSDALARTHSLRAAATQRPILVVTDDPHGLDSGGVINFLEADRNVRFEVSLGASDRARLKIDSALLSVAAHVAKRGEK
jgi:YfiR/HmsC-like